jgi:hypothetical protein
MINIYSYTKVKLIDPNHQYILGELVCYSGLCLTDNALLAYSVLLSLTLLGILHNITTNRMNISRLYICFD